jgi:ribose transport system ATP-binding protein
VTQAVAGRTRHDAVAARPPREQRKISKTVGRAKALDDVALSVARGEVHGLLGQNGSGKSTLIKILAGFHEPDPGARLQLDGRVVGLPLKPGEFRRHRVSFVHQNLGLVPSLTVLENLLIGQLASQARFWISWDEERKRARELFERYRLDMDPNAPVSRLSPVKRALLAIVRAVEEIGGGSATSGTTPARGGVLILDEPTPFLPRADVEQLFALVRSIVAAGNSVIFVSHDVDEVTEITDRATVLRDGRHAGTLITRQSGKEDFIELIVGRKLQALTSGPTNFGQAAPSVVIEDLTGGTLDRIRIGAHRGEVVGLTGLIGSGFDEVPYLVYGASPAERGRLRIDEDSIDLAKATPATAVRRGIVLVPGDRQNAGAIGALPVSDNVTMPVLGRLFNPLFLNRGRMVAHAARIADAFDVVPRDPLVRFSLLSGGNQQKVVLGKWMQVAPKLILLDEPTQGVDVGARQRVYEAIQRAAGDGVTILCASSDYEQLATICDRVLIFAHGRVIGELTGASVSKENIALHCYNSLGGEVLRNRSVSR